ncbi:LytTR family transcriptional regulator DNA-binding domain-containing protein [Enterococcus hirae]|uniref:LytTR family transcriptional regulator DNA-binding domain-containing protein n=1 Tax=Enterococcus hirae TaxID=1354 RepID=UPI001C6F2070|nr:LytTR family transcriptional regulator DNA-binding domain-containing protein [Enterococcus hirae]
MCVKVYYIEDNVFHQEEFRKQYNRSANLAAISLTIPLPSQLEKFYADLDFMPIQDSDIFIVDIELNRFHSGVDFSKKIRQRNHSCYILFLTNDTTKGMEIINQNIRADKYYSKKDIMEAVNGLEELLFNHSNLQQGQSKLIKIESLSKIYLIDPKEVNYLSKITGSRSTIEFFCQTEFFLIHGKIEELKQTFQNFHFFNDLKSYSINPANIKLVDKKNNEIVFKNDDTLILSRRSIKKLVDFMEHLKNENHLVH